MRDLREYSKQTNIRLALGAFLLLFIVGVGLIWFIYGGNAAGHYGFGNQRTLLPDYCF